MNTKEASCPECEHRLKLRGHAHKGQRVICPECGTDLTVVSLSPVELELTVSVNHSANPKRQPHTIEVACPECDDFIKLNAHSHPGYRVLCTGCNTALEVVRTKPLELDVTLTVNHKYNHRYEFQERRYPAKKPDRDQGHKR